MSAPDRELEAQIALLESPFGGEPDVRERERAAVWLLANPGRSYAALLARVMDGRAGADTIELLGRFERDESVPALARLLGDEEPAGSAAARGLAVHPAPTALEALRTGLRSGGDRAVRCADALAVRGDAIACEDLRAAATAAEARPRYHAVQAAAHLECFSRAELAEIAASDPDADVRDLARRLAG